MASNIPKFIDECDEDDNNPQIPLDIDSNEPMVSKTTNKNSNLFDNLKVTDDNYANNAKSSPYNKKNINLNDIGFAFPSEMTNSNLNSPIDTKTTKTKATKHKRPTSILKKSNSNSNSNRNNSLITPSSESYSSFSVLYQAMPLAPICQLNDFNSNSFLHMSHSRSNDSFQQYTDSVNNIEVIDNYETNHKNNKNIIKSSKANYRKHSASTSSSANNNYINPNRTNNKTLIKLINRKERENVKRSPSSISAGYNSQGDTTPSSLLLPPPLPYQQQQQQPINTEFLIHLERLLDKQFNPIVDRISKTLKDNETRREERLLQELIQSEWTDLAMIADNMLCYFFPIMTLFTCLFIFFNSPHTFSQW
jgi:hypothetical protein